MRFRFREPEAMLRAAFALARSLDSEGVVLSLNGPLGAGKTVFVKGLAEGLGVAAAIVASPTFSIANEYETAGGGWLRHVDFYRVEEARELEELGFEDFLEAGALLAVEWGNRFPDALPRDHVELKIDRPPEVPGTRMAQAVAHGESSRRVLERWRTRLVETNQPGME